jgi:hypothetical protein
LRVDYFNFYFSRECGRHEGEYGDNGAEHAHTSSFSRERGCGGRIAPVSWLASKDALRASGFLPTAFPGLFLVTGGDFLAYSCAAARDLHPLSSLCREAKTRTPKDLKKNENSV